MGEQRDGSVSPKRPANPAGEELALQVMAVLGGGGAVIALPLLAAAIAGQAPAQVTALVFAFPLALATVGRLREQRHWQVAAAVVAVVVAVLLVVASTITAVSVVLLLLVGAPMSLVLIGRYLLDQDRLAGVAWLVCTSIALLIGLLALGYEIPGAGGAMSLIALAGCLLALYRVRRRPRGQHSAR